MDNGFDGKLADKLSGLGIGDPSAAANFQSSSNNHNDSLFQVMKAVEDAEATIKQQVEENNRLRNELHEKIVELEQFKAYELARRPRPIDAWSENVHGTCEGHQLTTSVGNPENEIKSVIHISSGDGPGTVVVHRDLSPYGEVTAGQSLGDGPTQSRKANGTSTLVVHRDLNPHGEGTIRQSLGDVPPESREANGTLKVTPGDNSGFTQLSSPSSSSLSPNRYQAAGEFDRRLNSAGHGLMSMAEVNNLSSFQKQDLIHKVQEHEQEIVQLRRRLAEYSVKEAQIQNEKYVFEKRIAYMRLAFDQQQQDLVDAASKALSYRQDIMEENIRLSYQLQAAQQERLTFVSSLLPLLAEYSLQPPVPDAQSIVSNVKVLFKHLQEQLNITESKLKESQFQLTPWLSEANSSNVAMQSSTHSVGPAVSPTKDGLQLVPQPPFTPGKIPISSTETFVAGGWDVMNQHQIGLGGVLPKNTEPDDLGRFSPLASRSPMARDVPGQFGAIRSDANVAHQNEETTKQVKFREPVSNGEMDDTDVEALHNEGESQANWSSGNSAYSAPLDDPSSSYSPYLTPVLEEPTSSFSEGPDEDPLPAIDGLQISGDAFPGRELQACGYSINGTTSCNFEWVRHMEDGSVHYIEGAKQPNYLITADDVDTCLAIEVQPLDNRKRKGELVRVFANDHKKITCDPQMQNLIEKTFHSGHTSYKVSFSTGFLDIWEPATLAIKREGYTIKCSGSSGVVVTEKFSPNTTVGIPYGHATVFSIIGSNGTEHILRAENSPDDVSCCRDTIVLTLRLFVIRAAQKSKAKRRSIFSNK